MAKFALNYGYFGLILGHLQNLYPSHWIVKKIRNKTAEFSINGFSQIVSKKATITILFYFDRKINNIILVTY